MMPKGPHVALTRTAIVLVATAIGPLAHCQGVKRNAAYLELLGNAGGWVSGNYERLLSKGTGDLNIATRLGLTFSANQYDGRIAYHVPLEVLGYVGRGKWRFECGLGYSSFWGTSHLDDERIPEQYKSNRGNWFVPRIGVRMVGDDGTILRIAPMYLWGGWSNGREDSFWSIGIALGWPF